MTVRAPDTTLRVYKDGRPVGLLTSDANGTLGFAYDAALVETARDVPARAGADAVRVRMPVRAKAYGHDDARACFENLLPEGDVRNVVALSARRSAGDVVGLLGVLGGECAGALSLWPPVCVPPATPVYRPCAPRDLAGAFGDAQDTARLALTLRESRASMSGAQDKVVLYREPGADPTPPAGDPRYALPVAGAPSSVLVKEDRGRYPGLLHNELAALRLMAAAGVPTASSTVCWLDPRVFETARFDRIVLPREPGVPAGAAGHAAIRRLHAEDGCQITGRPSRAKYAQTNGPAYRDLVTALARYSADAAADAEMLFRWAVANIALGNRDAHAKNISVLHTPRRGSDEAVVRLAPTYDVICTLVYPAIPAELPLLFGGVEHAAVLTPAVLVKAARAFGLRPDRARDLVADVCAGIDGARGDALHAVGQLAGAHPILGDVEAVVAAGTAETRTRLLG